MLLPLFTSDGVLPVGDYQMSLNEWRKSFLVTGQDVQSDAWDKDWRNRLVGNLGTMVDQLWQGGDHD